MGQRAAAVEQARHGVREQRASHHRTGHDLGALEEIARQHVEQILRQPPDGRGVHEQPVRIEVRPAVVAVPIVVVAGVHQHTELLELFQRLTFPFFQTSHVVDRSFRCPGSLGC